MIIYSSWIYYTLYVMLMIFIVEEMGTKNVDPQQRYSLGDMLGQG